MRKIKEQDTPASLKLESSSVGKRLREMCWVSSAVAALLTSLQIKANLNLDCI